jgi:CrcB protein
MTAGRALPHDPDVDLEDDRGSDATALGRGVARRYGWTDRAALLAAIVVGGSLGGVARYLLDTAFPTEPPQFPWALFGINIAGSLLLAVFMVLVIESRFAGTRVRPFWATGFLGAFTTFSTYVLALVQLSQAGAWGTALGYGLASIGGGLVAVAAGFRGGRRLVARRSVAT